MTGVTVQGSNRGGPDLLSGSDAGSPRSRQVSRYAELGTDRSATKARRALRMFAGRSATERAGAGAGHGRQPQRRVAVAPSAEHSRARGYPNALVFEPEARLMRNTTRGPAAGAPASPVCEAR